MKTLLVVKNMRLSNGVASYAMNYYRQLQGCEVHFDFLVVSDVGSLYYDEIKKSGGTVYIMPSYRKNTLAVIPYLYKLFKNNHYDIVHCNVMNSGSLILMMAKIQGVPVRILHSHATQTGDKKWKEIRNKLFCGISLRCANAYFSCSSLAGDYLFGKDNYRLISNAIAIDKYSYNIDIRTMLREKEGCSNKLVVITVGRFTKQKNPMFIVEIIKALLAQTKNFVFWWFGNGELEAEVKEYAVEKGVEEYIKFWGANEAVNEYYSAADVFILPSLYEGLPVVGIEAQVSGLPVLFSEQITKEAQISDAVEYFPIKDATLWASAICKYYNFDRVGNVQKLQLSEYRIEEQSVRLKALYEQLLGDFSHNRIQYLD